VGAQILVADRFGGRSQDRQHVCEDRPASAVRSTVLCWPTFAGSLASRFGAKSLDVGGSYGARSLRRTSQLSNHAEYTARTRGARDVERRCGLDAEGNPLKVSKPRSGSRTKQGG
jgi:hypothetical protein